MATLSNIEKAIWSFFASSFDKIFSSGVFLALGLLVGAVEIGKAAVVLVFIAFSRAMAKAASDPLVHYEEEGDSIRETVFITCVCVSLLWVLILLLSYPLLLGIYDGRQLLKLALLGILSILFLGSSSTYDAILLRGLELKRLAIKKLTSTMVGGAIGLGVAYTQGGAVSILWYYFSSSVVGLVLGVILTGWVPRTLPNFQRIRVHLDFSKWLVAGQFLQELNHRCVDVGLVFFVGFHETGLFRIAYQIHNLLVSFVIVPMSNLVLPILSRMSTKQALDAMKGGGEVVLLAAVPFFLISGTVFSLFLGLFDQSAWIGGDFVLTLLCLAVGSHVLNFVYIPALVSQGFPRSVFKVTLAQAMSSVIVVLVAGTSGFVLLVAAYVVRGYAVLGFLLSELRENLGVDTRELLLLILKTLGVSSLLFLAVAFVADCFLDSQIHRQIFQIVVFLIFYAIYLFFFQFGRLRVAFGDFFGDSVRGRRI